MREFRLTERTSFHKVETACRCDLCGVVAKGGSHSWNAEDDPLAYSTVSLSLETRENHDGIEIEVDICPDCFRNKLVPWVISQGHIQAVRQFRWNEADYRDVPLPDVVRDLRRANAELRLALVKASNPASNRDMRSVDAQIATLEKEIAELSAPAETPANRAGDVQ
jgi:hypothetical protein